MEDKGITAERLMAEIQGDFEALAVEIAAAMNAAKAGRIIADTENWDNSVGTNTPGQSGDPDNPHYRDLFQMWATGKYFPVFFSRAKIESVSGEKWILSPMR